MAVTEERLIAAPLADVWSVISRPTMHERLDARCRLESVDGGDGEVGSEYVLVVGGTVRLRYVIVRADPTGRLVAEVFHDSLSRGVQEAEITPQGDGTLLRWTVTLPAGRLARVLRGGAVRRELRAWLGAVDRESLTINS